MTIRNRTPGLPRNSDVPIKKAETRYYGMLSGVPASELPPGYSAKNYNIVDRGSHFDVRNGSRAYTSFKIGIEVDSVDPATEEITLESVHQWNTGDAVFMVGSSPPTPLVENTAYYVIKVSSRVIKLASTYSNAIFGTPINLTGAGVGTFHVFYGMPNAKFDHAGKRVFVIMFGNTVYVANKKLNIFTKVLNLHTVDPSGPSTMCGYENSVYLFSNAGIFRIELDDDFYWMDLINKAVPNTLITDINETTTLIYGYLYIYSMALLAGTGNRDRNDGTKILFESGTCNTGALKEYGERYYQYAVGINSSHNHPVGALTLPEGANGVTHFPLYRTRNIGENSGGSGFDINSVGNKRDFLLWVADVPVAKALVLDARVNGQVTVVSGNKFVRGDVGSVLLDRLGNAGVILTYIDENNVTVPLGSFMAIAENQFGIGGGRVMLCSQTGTIVLAGTGGMFVPDDRGLILFLSDGTHRHIVRYISNIYVEVAETGDFSLISGTIKPISGNFSRNWNDTITDDPQGDGKISWRDIELYASADYVPRRFFGPIPNCNAGVIDNGFAVCAKRDEANYWYSQIGDKLYTLGYYINPEQTRKVSGIIKYFALFSNKVVIFTDHSTIELVTTSSSNIGRTAVGENVFQLAEPNTIDPKTGLKAWQTAVFKSVRNTLYMFALCNDSSFRYFDGSAWGEDVSLINGFDAVAKKYLRLADHGYGVSGFYSISSGLVLWFRKWDDLANNTGNVYDAVQYFIDNVASEQEEQFMFGDYASGGNDDEDIQLIIL